MKKSIKVLKSAAAKDLTPRQIAKIYATVLPNVMDAPDGQFDAAITQAIKDLERIEALGGEQALLAKGIKPTNFSIAIQKQVLEQNLDIGGAQQIRYPQLQQSLADLPNYLQFDNGAPFQLGDLLTRPYSENDYFFLDAADTYKKIGGDPVMRTILAGEPRLVDVNLNLPLFDKFESIEKGNIIAKNGGFARLRQVLDQAKYEEWVRKNDLWNLSLKSPG
jgi:hypothetical protein